MKAITLTLVAWMISFSTFSQIPIWTEGHGSGSMNLNIYSSELGPDQKFLISGTIWGTRTQSQNFELGDLSLNIPATPYSGSWHYGFYAKLDTNGVISEVHVAAPPTNEQYVRSVYTSAAAQDADGNIYTGGRTQRDANIYGHDIGTLPGGNQDAYICKSAPDGTPLWIQVFGGNVIDEVQAIKVSDDGRIYLTGYFRNTCDFGSIQKTTTDSWSDGFIAEIDADGNFLWVKTIGGTDANYTTELDIDGDGHLYTATKFTQNYQLEDGTSFTAAQNAPGAVVVKMDPDGNTIWSHHCFGGSLNGVMNPVEMKVANDGKVWMGLEYGNILTTQEGVEYTRPHALNAACLVLDTLGNTYNVIAPETTGNSWFTGLGVAMEGTMMPGFTFEDEIFIGEEHLTRSGTNALFAVMTPDGALEGYGIGNNTSGESFQTFHNENLYLITRLFGGNNAIQDMDFPSGYQIGMAQIAGNDPPEIVTASQLITACADAAHFSIPFVVEDEEHETFSFSLESESDLIDPASFTVEPGAAAGAYIASVSIQNPAIINGAITIVANDGYAEGALSFDLELFDLPIIDPLADLELCEGDSVVLTASHNGVSGTWNGDYVEGDAVVPSDGEAFTFTATADNGCSVQDSFEVAVNPSPLITLPEDQEVCVGSIYTLTASAGDAEINWSQGFENNQDITVSEDLSLQVTAENSFGCQLTEAFNITALELPAVDAGPDQIVCEGDTITLNGSGDGTLTWSPDFENGASFAPLEDMILSLTATAENGCMAEDDMSIDWNEGPEPELSYANNALTATDGVTYEWYLNGELIPDENGSTIELMGDGGYQVVAFNAVGCQGASEILYVSTTGLQDKFGNSGLQLYPNPAAQTVFVKNETGSVLDVQMFSSTGKLVKAFVLQAGTKQMGLDNLPGGLYLLKSERGVERLMVR